MMKIKFRARRESDKEWVYGYYTCGDGDCHMIAEPIKSEHKYFVYHVVDPTTVGQ